MAHMTQENKKRIAKLLKSELGGGSTKWTLRVENHSTLLMIIRESDIDFKSSYCFNSWSGEKHELRNGSRSLDGAHMVGKARDFMNKAAKILNNDNHNNSDSMTDYFDVGWYAYICIGEFNKPYKYIGAQKEDDIVIEPKTKGDVEELKAIWNNDPCFTLEETEGFEEYHDELLIHRLQGEIQWLEKVNKMLLDDTKNLMNFNEERLSQKEVVVTTPTNKTKEDVNNLMVAWNNDPSWDIEEAEGFEDHYHELLAYRLERENEELTNQLEGLRAVTVGDIIDLMHRVRKLEENKK